MATIAYISKDISLSIGFETCVMYELLFRLCSDVYLLDVYYIYRLNILQIKQVPANVNSLMQLRKIRVITLNIIASKKWKCYNKINKSNIELLL